LELTDGSLEAVGPGSGADPRVDCHRENQRNEHQPQIPLGPPIGRPSLSAYDQALDYAEDRPSWKRRRRRQGYGVHRKPECLGLMLIHFLKERRESRDRQTASNPQQAG
jgi:hypothetical protein